MSEPDLTPNPITTAWSGESVARERRERALRDGCPTCGRKPNAPRKPSSLRGSKSFKLPKGADEDGIAILEEAINVAAPRLGYDASTPEYYVVARALQYVAYVASDAELVGIESA